MFSAATQAWFDASFATPTEIQKRGWAAIAAGQHTLLIAPTGSGKTLAAFLAGIDRCLTLPPDAPPGVRVLYVSPLKALVYDVERNLRAPLVGIARLATGLGMTVRSVSVDIRTGDTPQQDRRQQLRRPADILVTTPESLFLLLASRARESLRSVHTVIIDEVHALAAVKRGSHLALSLEWLAEVAESEPQRIGLSATVRPAEAVAAWLAGSTRTATVVDISQPPALDLSVVVPGVGFDIATAGAGALSTTAQPAGGSILARLYRQAAPSYGEEQRGFWPRITAALLAEITAARSTIVFVNSRGLCERLVNQLNELAGEVIAHAHHGSLARERRIEIEDALKTGRIRALVATSSLELGIDMGAVDKVLMVESPGSVARGLQRAGRAGHAVGEVSHARLYPKHRGDLLECAVIAARMCRGEIEAMRLPVNALDVLAQQLVAWVEARPMPVEAILARCQRALPYRDLARPILEAVLAMLAGQYAAGDFAEVRPLITWDRTLDLVTARRGAGMTVRLNAGVIPDRGLYAVYLGEGGPRLGELDEEMVYESRKGEVIQLGASSWRIEEITRDRVLVSPAPGEPGKLPFWRGDAPGRSLELGTSLGAFLRAAAARAEDDLAGWLRTQAPLDASAAADLAAYLNEQRAVGALPSDRTLVIERFRDELGDWRVCLLSPFGARVHAPWAIALQEILSRRAGFEVQVLYTDDGIVLRFTDTEELPDPALLLPEPEEVSRLVTEHLPQTALFAGLFRENAARALLTPRRQAQGRRPLWAQRIKAQQLMAAVSRYPDHPIVLETYRQALSDLFDLDGLRRILSDLRAGRIRVREVETRSASPFARSLVFAYVAANLYAGDAPLAEKRAQALTLDRRMLAELLGEAELADLLDHDSIDEVEARLQRLDPDHAVTDADGLHDLLRLLGDLRPQEIAKRCAAGADWSAWLNALQAARRAIPVQVAGEQRWIAAEDAGLYRDALGVPHPPGLPTDYLAPVEDALTRLFRRWVRRHGPFTSETLAQRYGLTPAQVEPVLALLTRDGVLQQGRIRPGGHAVEWVDVEVLKQIKRASLARLRQQAAPQEAAALGRLLPHWQGIPDKTGTRLNISPSADALLAAILPLEALPLPWSVLSLTLLPMRLPGFRPELLDWLTSSGTLVWLGVGPLGTRDGRVMLLRREQVGRLITASAYEPPSPLHTAILEHLAQRGASFLTEIESAVGRALPDTSAHEFEAALWDLVWAGRITNDSLAPLRQRLRGGAREPGAPRHAHTTLAGGRWSLVADLLTPDIALTERAVAWAEVLLNRYGIVSREAVRYEQAPPGWGALRQALKAMEETGRVRRGYFVEGLSGVQYARPGAVEALRRETEATTGTVQMLAALDPANPYGALLPWPAAAVRDATPRRLAGAWVVLVDGRLALYLQPGGHALFTFPAELDAPDTQIPLALAALKDLPPGGRRRVRLARIDGVAVEDSPLYPRLIELGFVRDYGGLVYPDDHGITVLD